jgi:DNA primase
MESVLPRMKDGRQAFFLFLPDGEDPDSLVRNEGAAGFDMRLAQATPLSQFFFDEIGKDVNLSTLDGKARLAERAKPLLAQIPDGAFGDLMRQRLGEITGVGMRAADTTPSPPPRPRAPIAPAQKRSLVRTAIALLLQQPSLALALEPPYGFSALRQPGVPLLAELVVLVRERPDITTGALLEHFAEREEYGALQKLSIQEPLIEANSWQAEFDGAMKLIELDALKQERDELKRKVAESGLSSLDEYEKLRIREIEPMIRSAEHTIKTSQ